MVVKAPIVPKLFLIYFGHTKNEAYCYFCYKSVCVFLKCPGDREKVEPRYGGFDPRPLHLEANHDPRPAINRSDLSLAGTPFDYDGYRSL